MLGRLPSQGFLCIIACGFRGTDPQPSIGAFEVEGLHCFWGLLGQECCVSVSAECIASLISSRSSLGFWEFRFANNCVDNFDPDWIERFFTRISVQNTTDSSTELYHLLSPSLIALPPQHVVRTRSSTVRWGSHVSERWLVSGALPTLLYSHLQRFSGAPCESGRFTLVCRFSWLSGYHASSEVASRSLSSDTKSL